MEVFTKVRYEGSAETVVGLREKIEDSVIRVIHSGDDGNDCYQDRTTRDVFDATTELFERRPDMEFSFPEAALVLSLVRERENRNRPVYLFTFDGTLAALADTFGVAVLPYATIPVAEPRQL